MSDCTTPLETFTGWLRVPPGRWQAVCHHDTEAEAWQDLQEQAARFAIVDLWAGPTGSVPWARLSGGNVSTCNASPTANQCCGE